MLLLLAVNAGCYFWLALAADNALQPPPELLLDFGARQGLRIHNGEFWRLFTAQFIHGNLPHLLLNMLGLFLIGPFLEAVYGARRLLAIYLLSGLAGNVYSQLLLDPATLALGASGAIFGLLGALLIHQTLLSGGLLRLMERPAGVNILLILLINLFGGFLIPGIDVNAHAGGLFFGAGLGFLYFTERLSELYQDPEKLRRLRVQRRLILAALAFMPVVGGSLLLLPNHNLLLQTGRHHLAAGDFEQALPAFREAARLAADTNRPAERLQLAATLAQVQFLNGDLAGAAQTYQDCLAQLLPAAADSAPQPPVSIFRRNLQLLNRLLAGAEQPSEFNAVYFRAQLAELQLQLGRPDTSRETLLPLVEAPLLEGNLEAYAQAALLLGHSGRRPEAVRLLERLLYKYPRHRGFMLAWLRLFLEPPQPRFEPALQVALKLQRLLEYDPWGIFLEGRVYENFGQYKTALQLYDRASSPVLGAAGNPLAADPDYWYHRGVCLLRVGETTAGLELLTSARNRLLLREPSGMERFDVEYELQLALLHTGAAQRAAALREQYLKTLADEAPLNHSWVGLNLRAYFLSAVNHNTSEALHLARESVRRAETEANLDTLAWALYRRGDFAVALQRQQQALQRAAVATPEMLFHLGAILEALDRRPQALEAYQQALAFGIDFTDRLETLRRRQQLLRNQK